jgi:hypothetical protein
MAYMGIYGAIKGHSFGHPPGILGATWGFPSGFWAWAWRAAATFLQNFPSLINFKNDTHVGYIKRSF